jgi:predicted ATPase
MLTRLKVSGFKNLAEVDVRFGPFTCIAGVNGVGKSNLFDAIQFLSALADRSPTEAAQSIRSEGRRAADIDSLFLRVGDESVDRMSFEAEMIVPRDFVDELGRQRAAKSTLLRYKVVVGRRRNGGDPLEIVYEELTSREKISPAFPHTRSWAGSVLFGRAVQTLRKLDENALFRNREKRLPATDISAAQTLVSIENAFGNPTVLAARREMQSWRLLQLEPVSLREVDNLESPTSLTIHGGHLPATLRHLADSGAPGLSPEQVYGQIAARLSELLGGVRDVCVDVDEKRRVLTLQVTDRNGTVHDARALSDGTLRFLALAVLELDPSAGGLICLEEPENGFHPDALPALVRLLRDIPADVTAPVAPDNPLRQVIVTR